MLTIATAQIATRLNIDVDFKFTATERIHAFFTPLQKNNAFTRFEFGGGDGNKKFNDEFDLKPQFVMAHFLVSIVLLTNAIWLYWRAGQPDGPTVRRAITSGRVVTMSRALVAM